MAYSLTSDYANLSLTVNIHEAEPADQIILTVAAILQADATTYDPKVTYKLFVQIPGGLRLDPAAGSIKNIVITSDGHSISVPALSSWSGGPDIAADIKPRWNLNAGDTREQQAYNEWLLATWTSDLVNEEDRELQTVIGWTIAVKVDSSYRFPADNVMMGAMLIAEQHESIKTPLTKSVAIQISAAEPAFAAVMLPDSPVSSGQSVVAAKSASVRVRATLAKATAAAKMQVRWQVQGAQGLWVPADPDDVTVIGGNQLEFTVHYDFTQPVTLRFSCAEPGGSHWGTPFALPISVISDLLIVENPLVRLEASKIILSCAVREPSAQVKFVQLELSVDGGAHWQDISDKKAGSTLPLTFSNDITGTAAKDRDFSQGVYLRATDSLHRVTPHQPARFDAASFLSATWDGASAVLDDINVGEALTYSVHLHCASGVVLPPATLSMQLADAAVEADSSARSWYWMMDETSGEPKGAAFDSAGWRGTAVASQIYRGPIQSGLVSALARVRSDEALLGKTLPPASLTIAGSEFFVSPFVSVEPVRAKVWQPAPYFQFVNMALHTNKLGVILRGDFIPPVEPSAALTFTACIDEGVAHPVTPSLVTTNQFELKLDPAVFTAFEHNGSYSVQLAVRRSADTRPDERSSHRATLALNINNSELITGS